MNFEDFWRCLTSCKIFKVAILIGKQEQNFVSTFPNNILEVFPEKQFFGKNPDTNVIFHFWKNIKQSSQEYIF